MQAKPNHKHNPDNAVGSVITGTTGFVGGELLIKLLRDTSRSLICPVRADSQRAAQERGKERLVVLVGEADASHYADRITWLRGDIEERHLGWGDEQWNDIAQRTHEIYHCAASVSFDLPLDQAHRINVVGTQHVFELAAAAVTHHNDFRRFHHVSTAYVAGRTSGNVNSDFLPSDRAKNFRNTYERTKARAERFLRNNASHRVPVSIHRPSIIAGNSKTGRTTNWNVMYVPMKMVARGVLPAFTYGGRQLVDAVAVDFLVEAMVAFSQLDSKPLESHHLTAGPTAITTTDVIRQTAEQAKLRDKLKPSDTKMLGPLQWRILMAGIAAASRLPASRLPKRVGRVRTKARVAQRCMDGCSVYLAYANVNVSFDATHDHKVLRVFGIEMPAGPDYLDTILDYALATNFGKDVAAAQVAAA